MPTVASYRDSKASLPPSRRRRAHSAAPVPRCSPTAAPYLAHCRTATRCPPCCSVLVAIFDGGGVPVPSAGESAETTGRRPSAARPAHFPAREDATVAMDTRGSGAVVVIAPEAGLIGVRGASVVAGAAGALFAAARTLAIEYAPTVRINMIAYGCVARDPYSEWLRSDDPNGTQALDESLTLLERLAGPNEVATAAAFLASDRASFVVAHQLVVDGGYLVH